MCIERETLGIAVLSVCLGGGLLACGSGPLEVEFEPSHSLTISAGRELDVTLGTVGPGDYASPPTISSTAVRFLDVQLVAPYVPAGPRQQFRFMAVGPGDAVITFHHTDGGPTVEDTVRVH